MGNCKHVFVLGNQLVVNEAEASMIPNCYYCVRCDRTLFELTGIMGPPVLIADTEMHEEDEVRTEAQIGDKVRDKVTGFEGIAYGRWVCITGCVSFDVHPPAKDGKIPASQWIDDSRLEVIKEAAVTLTVKAREPSGPCDLDPPTDGPR